MFLKGTLPFWRGADLAKNLPKYFEALKSHDQHLWQLKEVYYEHTQQHPRHVYRKADQNRLGYSNANPSYWAMGYATLDDFKRMAPAKVVLEYTARNLNPRAQSAWTKGVGGKFELMKTVGTEVPVLIIGRQHKVAGVACCRPREDAEGGLVHPINILESTKTEVDGGSCHWPRKI